jgi:transposase-like protein
LTNDDVIHRSRLRLFALARKMGSVRAACRLLGVHHSTYYRWRRQLVRFGPELLAQHRYADVVIEVHVHTAQTPGELVAHGNRADLKSGDVGQLATVVPWMTPGEPTPTAFTR